MSGWDFAWLTGRATEQRPSWGYQRLLAQRLAGVQAALDLHTGGGEVLAGVPAFPPTMAATEAWPSNLVAATRRLHPLGIVVVAQPSQPPLPFADAAFDLVTSRHPAVIWWAEIARVLRPGGHYFAQHVGPESMRELYEWLLGPQPHQRHPRHPDRETALARAAGPTVTDARMQRLPVRFFDIGAVVSFLRTVVWTVPDFSIERDRER